MKENTNYLQYEEETLKKVQTVLIEILEDFQKLCEEHHLTYFLVFGSAIGAVRHEGFIPWDDDLDVGMPRKDYEEFLKICRDRQGEYEVLSVLTDKENASTVTKYQKKGTLFVAHHSRFLKNPIGIAIDVFPIDAAPAELGKQKRQVLEALFWEKLLFLRKTPFPYIGIGGIKGTLARAVCVCLYGIMNFFHVPTQWIYKRFDHVVQRYNGSDSSFVSCFMAPNRLDYRWEYKEMFPMQKVKFGTIESQIPANNDDVLRQVYGDYMQLPPMEKRVNHAPLELKF